MSRPDAKIVDHHFVIGGKEVIAARYGVKQFMWLDEERLVLVLGAGRNYEEDNQGSRNVICINTRGEVQWIMENHMDNPYRSNGGSPVSKIELMDRGLFPGHIVAWNGDHRMAIDKDTGKLLGVEFTK